MPKAILITKDNVSRLKMQYDDGDDEMDEYIGLYLVADFGGTAPYGYLTKENLAAGFQIVKDKKPLENEFFEVEERVKDSQE